MQGQSLNPKARQQSVTPADPPGAFRDEALGERELSGDDESISPTTEHSLWLCLNHRSLRQRRKQRPSRGHHILISNRQTGAHDTAVYVYPTGNEERPHSVICLRIGSTHCGAGFTHQMTCPFDAVKTRCGRAPELSSNTASCASRIASGTWRKLRANRRRMSESGTSCPPSETRRRTRSMRSSRESPGDGRRHPRLEHWPWTGNR